MAYFAQLDANNKVVKVIAIGNGDCGEPTLTFPDTCAVGRAFIANSLGFGGVWKQTSYNTYIDSDNISKHRLGGTPFRGTYAGIGYTYNAVTDTFTPPVVEVNNETEL